MTQPLKITALVSIGLHGKSFRPRKADQDARAVELGLQLAGEQLQLLHAGNQHEAVLRGYLAMGSGPLTQIMLESDRDIVLPLSEQLRQQKPDIVLTGERSESGESSGMLPYLLAEKLGWPIVSGIAEIRDVADGFAEVLQALPRGKRRAIKVALPFIASVNHAASEPRQSAFAKGQRSVVRHIHCQAETDNLWAESSVQKARKRPKRLKVIKAKTAADRFKAATAKADSKGGLVMVNQPADEKARALLHLLKSEGVLKLH